MAIRSVILVIASIGSLALLAGCTGSGGTRMTFVPFQPGGLLQAPQPTAGFTRNISSVDPLLYVAGYSNNVVNIYDLGQPGDPLVGTITQGLSGPAGIALDGQGTLYVANYGGSTVTEYPFGATTPSVTLSEALVVPTGVTVDTNGDVYVTNRANPSGIVKYAAGQTRVSRYIVDPLIQVPTQISFDRYRNLYLADNNSLVSVMKHGTFTLQSLNLSSPAAASGVAIGSRNGKFFVSGSANTIDVYDLGSKALEYTLSPAVPCDFLAVGTFATHEIIFTEDSLGQTVYMYHQNARKPFHKLVTASGQAHGIALRP